MLFRVLASTQCCGGLVSIIVLGVLALLLGVCWLWSSCLSHALAILVSLVSCLLRDFASLKIRLIFSLLSFNFFLYFGYLSVVNFFFFLFLCTRDR